MSLSGRRLEGRVALITGAGGGIGVAVARRFASEGAMLALQDLSVEGLKNAASACGDFGLEPVIVVGDIRDDAVRRDLVGSAISAFSRLDIVVNNAGVLAPCPIEFMTEDVWDRAHEVNVKAAAMLIARALPRLRESSRAAIVNVASLAANVALPNMSAYCASKAALTGLTRALALDLHADNVRVNAVLPGVVDTPMPNSVIAAAPAERQAALRQSILARQIMKRMAHPAEIASVVAFLASDDASFVTGVSMPVDGGFSAW